jgi:hypothetical protein
VQGDQTTIIQNIIPDADSFRKSAAQIQSEVYRGAAMQRGRMRA